MTGVLARLQAAAVPSPGPGGEEVLLLSLSSEIEIACGAGLERREVETIAVENGILPARYQRSLGTVGWEGQLALLRATVGMVGVGGLGGWIAEGLARMGVGRLILIDGDVFEENNLNRQILATESTLGLPKVEVAQRRLADVNGAVEVTTHCCVVDEEAMLELLRGSAVLVDALDALPTRLALQRTSRALGVPLVHGAIAGYVGQVTTILPDDPGLLGLYGDSPPQKGVEVQFGNPAATPMMVAAWQIHEVIKLLTGRGVPMRRRMLFMDSEVCETDILEI